VDGAAERASPVRRALGMASGPRGDVEDPATATSAHPGDDQLGQFERGTDLDLEHQPVVALLEVLYGLEVGDRGVVDEHVDGSQLLLDGGDERTPVGLAGEIGVHRYRGTSRFGDRPNRALEAAW